MLVCGINDTVPKALGKAVVQSRNFFPLFEIPSFLFPEPAKTTNVYVENMQDYICKNVGIHYRPNRYENSPSGTTTLIVSKTLNYNTNVYVENKFKKYMLKHGKRFTVFTISKIALVELKDFLFSRSFNHIIDVCVKSVFAKYTLEFGNSFRIPQVLRTTLVELEQPIPNLGPPSFVFKTLREHFQSPPPNT